MNTNNLLTRPQLVCINAMISKLNLTGQKDNIIYGASNERTTSSRELTKDEATELIKYLKSQDPEEKDAEKMRRYIISMAHECGYRKPGTTTVDMKKLDNWCMQYGYLHKKLNQYLYKELPTLVTQFKKMRDGVINGV